MSAPVKYTCPDINACIESIKSIQKALDWNDEETIEDLHNVIQRASDDLGEYTQNNGWNPLEQLRDSNSSLREWGEKLEGQLEDKDKEIAELNERIQRYESHVDDLKTQVSDLSELIDQVDQQYNLIPKNN